MPRCGKSTTCVESCGKRRVKAVSKWEKLRHFPISCPPFPTSARFSMVPVRKDTASGSRILDFMSFRGSLFMFPTLNPACGRRDPGIDGFRPLLDSGFWMLNSHSHASPHSSSLHQPPTPPPYHIIHRNQASNAKTTPSRGSNLIPPFSLIPQLPPTPHFIARPQGLRGLAGTVLALSRQ